MARCRGHKLKVKPFSNGTEFMIWEENNCCRCIKYGKCKFHDEKIPESMGTGFITTKEYKTYIENDCDKCTYKLYLKAIEDHKKAINMFNETNDDKYLKQAENALIRKDKYTIRTNQ